MKSLLKRIIGVPDVELVEEKPERYCARVAVLKDEVKEPRSRVSLIDKNTGYDPYNTKP